MTEQFNLYAQYYDLLYKDKDYKKEAEYIHGLIQKNSPGSQTVLSLGCGTGRYEIELEKYGYEVVGIDISQQMIDIANVNKSKSESIFIQGDIRNIRLNKTFDVVISLFHVMCYQTSNDDLLKAFETASIHLNKGGIFLFDFWYGPGVLNDLPVVRVKRLENETLRIVRIAEPVMKRELNVVNVNYHILSLDKRSCQFNEFQEMHAMRYLFLPEIELFLSDSGFYLKNAGGWMTNKQLSLGWYGLVVANRMDQKD